MRDLPIYFKSTDAPPAGGDMRSWLIFYKLRTGSDEQLYVTQSKLLPQEGEAGDRIWFILDDRVMAVVPIEQVQEDCVNNNWEYWYNGEDIKEVSILLDEETLLDLIQGSLWDNLTSVKN